MCVSATLWNTAVRAYDDPSELQILPLSAAATILFTGITGGLVEVGSLLEFDGNTHLYVVVLRLSTLEAFEKTFSSTSLASTLRDSSGRLPRDHGASFQNVKHCGIRNRSKHVDHACAHFACALRRDTYHVHGVVLEEAAI